MKRLAQDLTAEFGRGFSERNLEMMRLFYLGWHATPVSVALVTLRPLLTVADLEARKYYEGEALQGGWSVRQLDSARITATFFEFLHDSATVALATKL